MSRTEETRELLRKFIKDSKEARIALVWENIAVDTGLSSHTLRRFHNGGGMQSDNVDTLHHYLMCE